MKITIHITKEIYRSSMMCGISDDTKGKHTSNCAVALAIREIAPKARVGSIYIYWDGAVAYPTLMKRLLPSPARNLIVVFDLSLPEERLKLPELSFTVDFPDEMINEIGIDQLKSILKTSENLELASL